MFYRKMAAAKRQLEGRIQIIQDQIRGLPEGTFFCAQNKKWVKWYRRINGKQIYIPKKQKALASRLAIKKYWTAMLEDLQRELTPVKAYLQSYQPPGDKAEQLLKRSGYAELLEPAFLPLSRELSEWMQAPFEQNKLYPDQLVHQITENLRVRSKAEAIIATYLLEQQIPFRYECALRLGTKTFYPDFTIRHPETGETFYYEHFGMMEQPEYSQKAFGKLQDYAAHGILPYRRLLATFETKTQPIHPKQITDLLQTYFL